MQCRFKEQRQIIAVISPPPVPHPLNCPLRYMLGNVDANFTGMLYMGRLPDPCAFVGFIEYFARGQIGLLMPIANAITSVDWKFGLFQDTETLCPSEKTNEEIQE
ncbi:MAG TPA: hypothetical protein V6C97_01070 [Oculatellaceae cyanobacterium]